MKGGVKMTSCKEIKYEEKKKTKFRVEIDIVSNFDDGSDERERIIKQLRGIDYSWSIDLADIIENG